MGTTDSKTTGPAGAPCLTPAISSGDAGISRPLLTHEAVSVVMTGGPASGAGAADADKADDENKTAEPKPVAAAAPTALKDCVPPEYGALAKQEDGSLEFRASNGAFGGAHDVCASAAAAAEFVQAAIDQYVATHRLTCCSFTGGIDVEVRHVNWCGTDEWHMAQTWLDALSRVVAYHDPSWVHAVPVDDNPAEGDEHPAANDKVDRARVAANRQACIDTGFNPDGPLGVSVVDWTAPEPKVDWDAVDWDAEDLYHDASPARTGPVGAKEAGAWPWEESCLKLARIGPRCLAAEDVIGSHVCSAREFFDVHDFAAGMHRAFVDVLAWATAVHARCDELLEGTSPPDAAATGGATGAGGLAGPDTKGAGNGDGTTLKVTAVEAAAVRLVKGNVPDPPSLRAELVVLREAIELSAAQVGVPVPAGLAQGEDL